MTRQPIPEGMRVIRCHPGKGGWCVELGKGWRRAAVWDEDVHVAVRYAVHLLETDDPCTETEMSKRFAWVDEPGDVRPS